jgi:hypothetical protein
VAEPAAGSRALWRGREHGRDAPGEIDLGLSTLYLRSPAAHAPLEVAVLLDAPFTTRCFRAVLDDLLAADFVRLAALLVRRPDAVPPARPWRSAWHALATRRTRRTAAFAFYEWLLDVPDPEDDPLAIVPCDDLLARVPVHPADAGGALAGLGLDVLLVLGASAPASLLPVARFGAWRYDHGAADPGRGGAAHFRELAEHRPVTAVRLRATRAGTPAATSAAAHEEFVLCRGEFPTSPTLSVNANRLAPFWGTQHFAIQKLNELHRFGWEHVARRAERLSAPPPRPARAPANGEFVGWATRELARRAARRLGTRDTLTDWFVGLRRTTSPLPQQGEEAASGLDGFRFLPNPPGRFLADPFLVERDGRTWLFVEDYGFDDRRGVISCGELEPSGRVRGLTPCLERPYHLSYPSVFWHDGVAWMVPESEQAGTVDLYRAEEFPFRWVHECTLLRLRSVDPTPFRHGDRWWLYVTHTAVPGIGVMTLLFHAPRLTGPWTLHPASPVSTDVRTARGAGPVWTQDGRLFRPSQDCAERYGRALVLNEVTTLTPDAYAERVERRIEIAPELGYDGLHHYHRLGDWEVVDTRGQALRKRFRQRPARVAAGSLAPVDLIPR